MDLVLTAEVYPADRADTMTLVDSVMGAQGHSSRVCRPMPIETVMADNGYHAAAHYLRWSLRSLSGWASRTHFKASEELQRFAYASSQPLWHPRSSASRHRSSRRLPVRWPRNEAPLLRKLGYFNGADKHVSACRNCWVSASTE